MFRLNLSLIYDFSLNGLEFRYKIHEPTTALAESKCVVASLSLSISMLSANITVKKKKKRIHFLDSVDGTFHEM
jgi:hypothetical protein